MGCTWEALRYVSLEKEMDDDNYKLQKNIVNNLLKVAVKHWHCTWETLRHISLEKKKDDIGHKKKTVGNLLQIAIKHLLKRFVFQFDQDPQTRGGGIWLQFTVTTI